ncbi:MAG: pyridoxamine 5'-phosphate oxidase family protein [Proteobacteria bacterium]|nr:pyridoxamine 5'-phosphate oxidase family protein [Pseudomonadota bacterium]
MTLKTERTRVKRSHERGSHDREQINAILDAIPFCHIGYLRDGAPFVMPTLQWREGDYVYWHGSSASSAIRGSRSNPVCLTVSSLDGVVLARSGLNHSVNFRSVMLLGDAEPVTDPDHKAAALKAMFDAMMPGRWDVLRPMSAKELKATGVLRLKITEGSSKIREGGPNDDDADYSLPIWAGVVPIETRLMPAIPDPRNLPDVTMPAHIADIKMGQSES